MERSRKLTLSYSIPSGSCNDLTPQRLSPFHKNILPRDEIRFGQKNCGPRHVFRPPPVSHKGLTGDALLLFFRETRRRKDGAGTDSVDQNFGGQALGQSLGQGDQASL